MKTKGLFHLIAVVAAIVLCELPPMASGYPFTDAFSYPAGNLAGNTNSETNTWSPMGTNGASGTTDIQVTNITLSYPGLSCPGTNSVYFGNLGYTERVAIHSATTNGVFVQSSGTLYYSYVFVVTNLYQDTTNGGFVSAFTTVTGPSTTEPGSGGARLYIRTSATNPPFGYEIGIGKNPNAASDVTWATNEFVAGQTNFVIASYTFVTNGTTNDVAQLWINPAAINFGAAIPPTPDATNIAGSDLQVGGANQIESFYFRQGNTNIPYLVVADLRIGTNWSDVTPPMNIAPARVPLGVTLSGANVMLVWSTNSSGFRLEGTPNLSGSSNAWTNVTAPINIVGTNYSVTDPVAGKNYYRLIYP